MKTSIAFIWWLIVCDIVINVVAASLAEHKKDFSKAIYYILWIIGELLILGLLK